MRSAKLIIMHKKTTLLHLSLIEGLGDATIHTILERVPDITSLYTMPEHVIQSFGIKQKKAELIVAGLADAALLTHELELIDKHNISLLTIVDQGYPELLRNIHCPPAVLYTIGAPLAYKEKGVAMVGSRQAGNYAQQVIETLVPPLVERNWTIVSGGALGADTMAHHAALAAGGKTVAVIGSGLLKPYPSSNNAMFKAIVAQGGTIVSPFPLTSIAYPQNFPARNRIIAGLSQATVVIQAAAKSGARITALFALDQGRLVCAVPGSIFDPLSLGCHKLIKEGATTVASVDDLLIELGEQPSAEPEQEGKQQELFVQPATRIQPKAVASKPATLSEHASTPEKILYYCRQQPMAPDELMPIVGLSLHALQEELFALQLAGKLEQNLTGMYEAI
jgi:DNA processing protein